MKKIFAMILALTMIMSLNLTAFAEEVTIENATQNNTSDKNVTVTVQEQAAAGTTYHVVVEWGSMNFTYSKGTQGDWDPENHQYGAATGAGWKQGENVADNVTSTIKVTNHSNAAVVVSAVATPVADTGVNVALAKTDAEDSETLATGVGLTYANADFVSYTLTVSGTPSDTFNSGSSVATITVTITASN